MRVKMGKHFFGRVCQNDCQIVLGGGGEMITQE